MKSFENRPALGGGIYTVPDIAQALRLPINKVGRWIRTYWDEKLGKEFSYGEIKAVWTDRKMRFAGSGAQT